MDGELERLRRDYDALAAHNLEIMALNRELLADNGFLRQALEEITKIPWGYDGDCGADLIARNALESKNEPNE